VNWQAAAGADLILGVAEVATEEQTWTAVAEEDWLCAWCLNRVANEKDRFTYEEESEFTFTNPAGIRFEIMTFSRTLGCRQAGVPTLDHTWFRGHAWAYCQCDRCGIHLGWFYTGEHEFAGLIRDRLVPGCVRN
jgi:hypothetical protein